MGICIGLYCMGFIYILLCRREKLPVICRGKTAKRMFLCMAAANTLAMIIFLTDAPAGVQEIKRNTYGKGKKAEELEVTVGKEVKKEKVQLEIQEKKYTEEKLKKVFEEAVEKLDKVILGENTKLDHIEHDLNLVKKLPDLPINITWELDRYDVMNVYGEIQSDQLTEEGTKIKLKGVLDYEGEKFTYLTEVTVYPQKLQGGKAVTEKIKDLVKAEDEKSREEPSVRLPDVIDGNKIIWEKRTDQRGYVILLLGMAASVSVYALKKQNERKKVIQERAQMMKDYPEIVSKLVLLLGAGMTVRNAWKKVVSDYSRRKSSLGTRKAYEEMSGTLYEIQSGVTEAEGYERFGRRCVLAPYMKLGALLSQNLKKGTGGLAVMLRAEAIQAFEERKNAARKLGEEASTKLLVPMFLMLAIVLVIVIVPAFLSVQL